MRISSICSISGDPENPRHIFLLCAFARALWFSTRKQRLIQEEPNQTIGQWLYTMCMKSKNVEIEGIPRWQISVLGLWLLGIGRNEARFKHTFPRIFTCRHRIIAVIHTIHSNPLDLVSMILHSHVHAVGVSGDICWRSCPPN